MLVGLIPARGGSKGIPRKNIRSFCGKPLIYWTINTAIKSQCFDRLIVSTEDKEIAKISIDCGAEVPFLRPKEIASDESSCFSVVKNLLENVPEASKVLTLQPTSPLRRIEDIRGILKFFESSKAESIVSLTEVTKHPSWMFSIDHDQNLTPVMNGGIPTSRQKLSKVYVLNGALYLGNKNYYLKEKKMITDKTLGYIMPKEVSIDIDNEIDWKIAEANLNASIKNLL